MPQFATYANLREWARESRPGLRTLAKEPLWTKDTFLSHSSKDDDKVDGAIRILQNHGARVYVDHYDPANMKENCVAIAAHVRSVISACKKFVLLATPQSKDSRWMPWELGLADGIRSHINAAVFPAAEQPFDQDWAQQEYLALYRKIVWGKLTGYNNELWLVWDAKLNQAEPLSGWLAR
ncbi:MAG: toll/interleukin-1 receptor domain-containing protein [Verrucomicrobia bacterium]|nr:toll/interleukin-1 receptor domain-containing protein [Verrucomicrobiota bacterium]